MKVLKFVFLLFLISGCNKKIIEAVNPPVVFKEFVVPNIKPKGNEKYLKNGSDYIFDQTQIRTYQLIMPATTYLNLKNDPAKEEYVEAALVLDGDTISPVGVRYKGSLGQYWGCLSGPDNNKPSGYKTCTKLSMQVKLNWKDRKEKFYDLNKLQFHSQNNDKSQLRERVGYDLFSAMGVPSPRAVHARLVINGVFSGLYGVIEEIDGRFVDYNFKEKNGNVYKEVWPITSKGKVNGDMEFRNALKTNESNTANVDIIREFGKEIIAANGDEIKTVIKKYMDVNKIMAYSAVDRLIRHDDGPFHWYCGDGWCSSHNFYWVEEPISKKIHMIPWDLDAVFEHVISPANPVTVIYDGWGETSNNCEPFTKPGQIVAQRSPACDKLTGGWVKFEDEYKDFKTKTQKGPLSEEQINKKIDAWTLQIRNSIIEANTLYGGTGAKTATSLADWESSVNTLKNQINAARTKP